MESSVPPPAWNRTIGEPDGLKGKPEKNTVANTLYRNLVATVSSYIGPQKAEASIGRQLLRCQATSESVTAENLRAILNHVIGATTLHLAPDKVKQQELTEKLKAIL